MNRLYEQKHILDSEKSDESFSTSLEQSNSASSEELIFSIDSDTLEKPVIDQTATSTPLVINTPPNQLHISSWSTTCLDEHEADGALTQDELIFSFDSDIIEENVTNHSSTPKPITTSPRLLPKKSRLTEALEEYENYGAITPIKAWLEAGEKIKNQPIKSFMDYTSHQRFFLPAETLSAVGPHPIPNKNPPRPYLDDITNKVFSKLSTPAPLKSTSLDECDPILHMFHMEL